MCSTHTPVTHEKEVVVYWPAVVCRCGLCDVLGDPSSCFAFEDASSRLRGDARAVPVAKAATSSASSVARSRERFGTARSEVRILPRRLSLPGGVIGSPPAPEAGPVMVRIHPRQPFVRVAERQGSRLQSVEFIGSTPIAHSTRMVIMV